MQSIELSVTGMTCVGCAQSIKRTLDSTAGIESSQLSFPSGRLAVTFDPARIESRAIVDEIRQSGFDAQFAGDDQRFGVLKQPASFTLPVINSNQNSSGSVDLASKHETRQQRLLMIGVALTIPLFILSMGRDFGIWQKLTGSNPGHIQHGLDG